MSATGQSPSADQLLAATSEGWWFHHADVVGRLVDLGRPDLALQAYRCLADRWDGDPRGEEYLTRAALVDQLVRLHPDPAVTAELHRLLGSGYPHVARRALHHLVRLGEIPAGTGTAAHVPPQLHGEIAPVLHDLDLGEAARQHLVAAATPAEQQRWWFNSYGDLAALEPHQLVDLAATAQEWFVRSWAARAMLARGLLDEGLAAYTALFPKPAEHSRDAAAAAEPQQAVAAIAAHLRHPGAQAAMVAAACTEYNQTRVAAVDALAAAAADIDVPGCIDALAARGPAGRIAAVALAARTGHHAQADTLLHAVLGDVRATHSSVAGSTLLAMGLPHHAAEAAAVLLTDAHRDTPVAHVGAAMKVLWQVGGPRALELIRWVAEGRRGVPRAWRDHHLRRQARHYQQLLERG